MPSKSYDVMNRTRSFMSGVRLPALIPMTIKKKKSINVTFLPDWRSGNPYQDLLATSLRKSGAVVNFFKMPTGYFALNRLPKTVLSSQIIHLHWINDLIGHILWPQSHLSRKLKLLLLYLDIVLLRLRGVTVVWTIHNLVAHESANATAELKARHAIARACSHVLVHSHSALKRVEKEYGYVFGDKATVTPHGNYDGCYSQSEAKLNRFKDKYSLSDHNIVIMFFGSVRRYKGVQHLLCAFRASSKSNLRLIIAGKSNTADLTQLLEEAADADPRIVLIPDFVSDDMVAPMFGAADAVAIPFEKTLTSGSTVLAMSMSKATLLPMDAKVFDLVDDQSSWFFNSVPELTTIFDNLDKLDLSERGVRARKLADELDWNSIGSTVYKAYEKSKLGRRADKSLAKFRKDQSVNATIFSNSRFL